MAFNNYCAIQTINRPALAQRWANARVNIAALEVYINNIIDPLRGQDDSIVAIPRFNGKYISLRFCGLEVFHVQDNGEIKFMLKKEGGLILNTDKPPTAQNTGALSAEVAALLAEICVFVQNYRMGPRDKQSRALVPGFQPEHWLESVIMADNPVGVRNRQRLGLNPQLSKCVTQAPAQPNPGKKKSRPIDILSVLADERVKRAEKRRGCS